jgi:hypothetical protein
MFICGMSSTVFVAHLKTELFVPLFFFVEILSIFCIQVLSYVHVHVELCDTVICTPVSQCVPCLLIFVIVVIYEKKTVF